MSTPIEVVEKLKARTAERRAAGTIPDYSRFDRSPVQRIVIPTVLSTTTLPCSYRGSIIESCTGCNGEARHVRQCFHDENPTETCTLGIVSGVIWSCSNCTKREA